MTQGSDRVNRLIFDKHGNGVTVDAVLVDCAGTVWAGSSASTRAVRLVRRVPEPLEQR
jgi:hypothetical protein